jgi:5-methyltetrahydrofolate--homocysteine methyltransferase
MLFWTAPGLRGNFEKRWRTRRARVELFNEHGRGEARSREFMKVRAVWQFFEAERDGNSIAIIRSGRGKCAGPHIPFSTAARWATSFA